MNYNIITDEAELLKFIDWLPELEYHETYYMCLFARNKYCAPGAMVHIKSDKQQLKRFTSDKIRMFDKIRQLECTLGAYTQGGKPIPQEALALYITPNPRNLMVATQKSLMKMAELCCRPYQGWNPQQEVMSEIQKAKSRTVYVDFDFDNVQYEDLHDKINILINPSAYTILQTRGGFHLLVRPELVSRTQEIHWYQKLSEMRGSDQCGSGGVIPVAGCTQGGFTPRFIC